MEVYLLTKHTEGMYHVEPTESDVLGIFVDETLALDFAKEDNGKENFQLIEFQVNATFSYYAISREHPISYTIEKLPVIGYKTGD